MNPLHSYSQAKFGDSRSSISRSAEELLNTHFSQATIELRYSRRTGHAAPRLKFKKQFNTSIRNYSIGFSNSAAVQDIFNRAYRGRVDLNNAPASVGVVARECSGIYATQVEAVEAAIKMLRRAHDQPSYDIEQIIAFKGKVESITGDEAHMLLVDEVNGKRFAAVCNAQQLIENQISNGDDFFCRVVRDSSGTKVVFEKIEKRELTESEVDALESKYRNLFS